MSLSRMHVGRRVAVFGPSGAGKSTVARAIATGLGVPVVELDALYHQANWQPTPRGEFRVRVMNALGQMPDGWVCDGNYRIARDLVLDRADTIVWLRRPFRVVLWRLVKRTFVRAAKREVLWNTNRESWRLSFMSRDSVICWMITHWREHIRSIEQSLAESPRRFNVIVLHSQAGVDEFLAGLAPGHSEAPPPPQRISP